MANYYLKNAYGQLIVQRKYGPTHDYCHYENTSRKCRDYFELASSGLIHLLKTLRDKYSLEYDKLAEYAILWLSYKLNMQTKRNFNNLNDFYTNYIENNKHYNEKIKGDGSLTYKEIIDKKKDMMNMNIKEISKFDIPFYILFYLNYVFHDEYLNCTYNSNLAKRFAKDFEELSKDSKNIEESLYNKILSTLSDDYNKLKNIYGNKKSCNFIALPKIEPKKKPSENIAQNRVENRVESPVENSRKDSGSNSLVNSGKGFEKLSVQTPEVTSSSSSILSTLIPGLSVVSVISVFLGIAYKYSLFGIDKLFQRQYLRKKLKKVKKKMKLNI
ncbi:PIR protein CIR protein [Plasmodium vinckei petteri]|uniref:PIR protein CIR protein n=1 Tax=Plasmodium vinckei petteri TaxID=138298 RepID=A0A6V7T9Q0_PLAVN|nr:PIR protein CIR protein [Plasmodium vinckei petteri]